MADEIEPVASSASTDLTKTDKIPSSQNNNSELPYKADNKSSQLSQTSAVSGNHDRVSINEKKNSDSQKNRTDSQSINHFASSWQDSIAALKTHQIPEDSKDLKTFDKKAKQDTASEKAKNPDIKSGQKSPKATRDPFQKPSQDVIDKNKPASPEQKKADYERFRDEYRKKDAKADDSKIMNVYEKSLGIDNILRDEKTDPEIKRQFARDRIEMRTGEKAKEEDINKELSAIEGINSFEKFKKDHPARNYDAGNNIEFSETRQMADFMKQKYGIDVRNLNKDNYQDAVSKMTEAKTGQPATEEQKMKETGALAKSGISSEAVAQHTQNIMDKTRPEFTKNFTEKFQKDNGRKPSQEEITKAHGQEFLRAFCAFGPYGGAGKDGTGWGATVHGIEPTMVDSSFQKDEIKNMMDQYPNALEVPYSDGTVEKVSLPHALNQMEGSFGKTLPDVKNMAPWEKGVFNRSVALPWASGTFAEWLHKDQSEWEPGTIGSLAGESPALKEQFYKDPVDAIRGFCKDPRKYLLDVANREILPTTIAKYKFAGGPGNIQFINGRWVTVVE